ncbi:MAG: tetratricopeptide repeat protein [Mariprofundaceae bacterium]|nr:tetratricopeptide repeat protein [Mariprofundaceae bacterium]
MQSNANTDTQAVVEEATGLFRQGLLPQAEQECMRVLSHQPANGSALHLLGLVYLQAGMIADAVEMLGKAVSKHTGEAAWQANLAVALKRRAEEIQQQPDFAGEELQQQAEALFAASLRHVNKAIRLQGNFTDAYFNRAMLFKRKGDWKGALQSLKNVVRLNPRCFEAWNEMGHLHLKFGDPAAAREAFLKASDSPEHGHAAYSNYLLSLNYDEQDPAEVYAAHLGWDTRYAEGVEGFTEYGNTTDAGRCLNIGYVSPDLREHSVAYFAAVPIIGHSRAGFRVCCYSDARSRDGMQAQLQQAADVWRDTADLSDAALCEMIRRDGIDILVDLAGHTSRNRLRAFAARPAPLQLSYIGYPNTSGLSAMTHRISDAIADPDANDAFYSEQLLRLPGGFLSYRPPLAAQQVSLQQISLNSDRDESQALVFGCFNVLAKLSDASLRMWAEVLHACPDSKLLIKNASMRNPSARKGLQDRFRQLGIRQKRLELIGWQDSLEDHYRLYGRIDIALDTFPYNGTTTTCEALYMGVPVVSRNGQAHASRVGASLLSRTGLDELVADSSQAFADICIALAADAGRRAGLRAQAAEQSRRALCDGPALIAELEDAYRRIWRQWCDGYQGDGSFS